MSAVPRMNDPRRNAPRRPSRRRGAAALPAAGRLPASRSRRRVRTASPIGALTISAALALFLASYVVAGMLGSALFEQARERSITLAAQERSLREQIQMIRAGSSEWAAQATLDAAAAEAGMTRPGMGEGDGEEQKAGEEA